ncbi:tetratricopeptide repeat protein [Pelagicoccus albus]|uniref:Uncharacterized protein n=1 Tax=Pelagicoccus albus TaxID=415222 RepID=A0A7X1B5P9_9BACT|nr:hypothetical protein [Pelagicoccus albus]MBC2605023.1 hypothetical protein [Pelagicoccus albus]
MSAPDTPAPTKPPLFIRHIWWATLIFALLTHWFSTANRIDQITSLSAIENWSVETPARDNDSPTGYELGQRNLIIPGHHNPSYWWITEAQLSAEQGSFRLRHIEYDSAPEGREAFRTSPYRIWLTATGWLYGTIKNEPLGYSIERAALFSDPLLFGIFLALGTLYTALFIGRISAALFPLTCLWIFPLNASFQAGAPDPHSLSWVLALGSLLPLFSNAKNARWHFAAAGVFGGLGLWNDADFQLPVLLMTLIAGIVGELFSPKNEDRSGPWFNWGVSSATIVLASSLFELGSESFSLNLDTVNPLQALFYLGAGGLLSSLSRFKRTGWAEFKTSHRAVLIASLVLLLLWPIASMISETGSLLANDFYARQIANHPSGGIAESFGAWLQKSDGAMKFAVLAPVAALFYALALLVMGKVGSEIRSRALFAFSAAFLAFVISMIQIRWWSLFDLYIVCLIAVLCSKVDSTSILDILKKIAVAAISLPGLLVSLTQDGYATDIAQLNTLQKQSFVERDFAHWLNKRSSDQEMVLFSTPMFSSGAAYYGGFDVIVSADEANKTGYDKAIRLASSDSQQETTILLESNKITHVVLPMWDPMFEQFVRIGTGKPRGEELPQNAFVVALKDWDIPLWMQALNYSLPQGSGLESFELNAFALQAEQDPEMALSRLADLFVERGKLWEAKSIREALTQYPRDVNALAAIANIDYATREKAKLEESMEAVIPYLSRRSARNLPLDRRVNLAALFARTQKLDLAKTQIRAGMDNLDAEQLKRLSPAATGALLALSKALKIPFPDDELEQTALELVATEVRQKFEN